MMGISNGQKLFDREGEGRSLSELIRETDNLPSSQNAQTVIEALVSALHSESGQLKGFRQVRLTSIPIEKHMWDRKRRRNDGGVSVRLKGDLTGERFWTPIDETITAIVFDFEDETDDMSEWPEIVHPHLAASGKGEVRRALVKWLAREILDTSTKLEFLLRRLECLREQGTL